MTKGKNEHIYSISRGFTIESEGGDSLPRQPPQGSFGFPAWLTIGLLFVTAASLALLIRSCAAPQSRNGSESARPALEQSETRRIEGLPALESQGTHVPEAIAIDEPIRRSAGETCAIEIELYDESVPLTANLAGRIQPAVCTRSDPRESETVIHDPGPTKTYRFGGGPYTLQVTVPTRTTVRYIGHVPNRYGP